MNNWRGIMEQVARIMAGYMRGRYGQDELNRFLMIVSLVLLVVSIVVPEANYIVFVLLGWCIYRCYSKNFAKRYEELQYYRKVSAKPKQWLALQKRIWDERDTHRYFTCEQCKTTLRVPKGKGKIEVTCPKCGDKKIRKS